MQNKEKEDAKQRIYPPPASSLAALHRMQAAKSKDTSPEITMRSVLHKKGLKFEVNSKITQEINSKADILFRKEKIVIFIDGCFWHGCPTHGTISKSNREYWDKKILQNKIRDKWITKELRLRGWIVMRIWEHEINENIKKTSAKVIKQLRRRKTNCKFDILG